MNTPDVGDRFRFSIITPAFNALPYLKRCCSSVADQSDMRHEHIVVDGGSSDGTVEWLKQQSGVKWISEKDRGMYDAINKGFEMARGEIVAYLNCDEQYLPGALVSAAEAFERYPDADIVFGDALLIRPDGSLIAFRKSYPLRWSYVLAGHLYVLSCTLFFRRRVLEKGFRFNPEFRSVGDADFVVRLLRSGCRARHFRRYVAVFTMTGTNLSAEEKFRTEPSALAASAPIWVRALRPVLNMSRLAEKLLYGAYVNTGPIEYALYDDPGSARKYFSVRNASFRWKLD